MALQENIDYVFYEKGTMMNYKQPMKNVTVVVVSTKNYVFYVPLKTVGTFGFFNTIKTHQYFDGVSIPEGVQKIIANAESVDALEKSMIALLEDDDKYVHKIADKNSFKFKGFLGRHTLRMATSKTKWSSIYANGKKQSKAFRTFHGQ